MLCGCVVACAPDKPPSQQIAELCAETYSAPDDVESCKLREAERVLLGREDDKQASADRAADRLR
jgi:hypothetical protein